MVPRACAKAAVPGETAGGWPETGEVSMISSSPPAHASTRETHLRRCSSHPPLRLRSCPPRQRQQVASEGLRGARVCPQLTSNSRAGDTQDGARSSKNLDGCTRASPRSQPLLKRGRCPGAQPLSRTNKGAIANRLVHRRPTAGMCATSQVEVHAFDGRRRHHHVLIRIPRSKEGRPLADSHKAWLM